MNCFQAKQILREAGNSKPYSYNQEGRHLTWMPYLSYATFFLSSTVSRKQLFAHHFENLAIHLNLRLWGLIKPRIQLHLCQRSKCLIIMRHASMISPQNKYALQPYFIFSNPEANKEPKAEVMDSKMRQLKAFHNLHRWRLIVLLITNTKPAQFRCHCVREFSWQMIIWLNKHFCTHSSLVIVLNTENDFK